MGNPLDAPMPGWDVVALKKTLISNKHGPFSTRVGMPCIHVLVS